MEGTLGILHAKERAAEGQLAEEQTAAVRLAALIGCTPTEVLAGLPPAALLPWIVVTGEVQQLRLQPAQLARLCYTSAEVTCDSCREAGTDKC
jgi:hypothetical protein